MRSHSQLLPRGPSVGSSSFFTRGNLPEVKLRSHQGSHLHLVTGGSDGGGEGKTELPFAPLGSRRTDMSPGGQKQPGWGDDCRWRAATGAPGAKSSWQKDTEVWAHPFGFHFCPRPGAAAQPLSAPRDTPRPCSDRPLLRCHSGISSAPEPSFCAKQGSQGCPLLGCRLVSGSVGRRDRGAQLTVP